MNKIVVLDGHSLNPGDLDWSPLKALGNVKIYNRTDEELLNERIEDADFLITNKTILSRKFLSDHPKIKYIGVLATGYNVVDIEACKELGITVTNIPSYGTQAVAQYVFALLLDICHKVSHHNHRVKSGAWSESKDFCFWDFPLIELQGKTLGIIGYGKIGQATANIAKAFGINVVFSDDTKCQLSGYAELNELFRVSDIISLHCPLTPDTNKIINSDSINLMKDGVILINTSRGPLIDEDALIIALRQKKISWAALDVLNYEPPHSDNPLLKLDNCIITPHIAWAPKESRERLLNTAIKNIKSFIQGEPINTV